MKTIMAVSILKVFVSLLLCSVNFYQEDVRIKAVAAENVGEINIGVILDMDWYGKVAKTAFEIAAEDVNKENKLPNSSRLVLHFHFSGGERGNAVMAASAAVDLLRNQEVVAIIGPQTSQEAGFVATLCNASKVPMVSFSVTDPLLSAQRYPYFIRLPHSDAVQADAIAALVEYYGWREVVAVYADNDYGTGVLPFLTESLSNVGCAISYRSAIPTNLNSTAARAKLSELKDNQTRVFIVHMTSDLGTILFSEAQKMEMMTTDYAWIITEGFSARLGHSLNKSSIASMQGILGTRTYMPISNQSLDFGRRWKSRFIAENPKEAKRAELNIYGYYAYDAVRMIARALQTFDKAVFNFSPSSDNPNVSFNTQLSNLPVFQQGEQMLLLLGNTNFTGLSGQLQVIEGEIAGATYEILNVIGKGYSTVGYWRKGIGLSNSSWDGQLENVTWPGGLTNKPRGWAMPAISNSKIRIAVPVSNGFGEFVRTDKNASRDWVVVPHDPGFVIEMFDAVVKNLSYSVPYEYIPYSYGSESPGYYDDIIEKVSSSKEACGVQHKVNDTFRGNPKEQVTTFLWFSFSTLFFSQREKVVSTLARGVIIIWLFVVLILQSSYTANLTAILTAKQLQPAIQDVESLKASGKSVGYPAGSFVDDYLVEHLGIERTKLKNYSSPEEYAAALSNESVAAIFDELPYICVFLWKQPGFTIVGETYRTGGLGFAFPKGSPLVSDMSTSVLEISESPEAQRIRKKYFNNTDCSNAGSQANSNPRLSMESFWGLFLITGSASALGLLIYLGRLVYTFRHRLPEEQQQFSSTIHLIFSVLKSFLNYMDEKEASDKSKETSRESDQSVPETPNFGTDISSPPPGESQEDEGYEDTISSASSLRSSSFFSLPEGAWTDSLPQNLHTE